MFDVCINVSWPEYWAEELFDNVKKLSPKLELLAITGIPYNSTNYLSALDSLLNNFPNLIHLNLTGSCFPFMVGALHFWCLTLHQVS